MMVQLVASMNVILRRNRTLSSIVCFTITDDFNFIEVQLDEDQAIMSTIKPRNLFLRWNRTITSSLALALEQAVWWLIPGSITGITPP
jgi:hypothetical protein